jgi:hypothetical protein
VVVWCCVVARQACGVRQQLEVLLYLLQVGMQGTGVMVLLCITRATDSCSKNYVDTALLQPVSIAHTETIEHLVCATILLLLLLLLLLQVPFAVLASMACSCPHITRVEPQAVQIR